MHCGVDSAPDKSMSRVVGGLVRKTLHRYLEARMI
ncbi:hypothetical protein BN381_120009 [Candidatus Microthrix parvicella RN1]|uniref:Uncharacterized protein n=1 Tax=Candidatus Neomicrothrix parvicella RN1 TaxID=1229780 RepID=R4YWR1_9ACTN|nr:hypothetical protein BN381_120009 [Candidatus Microthrix parvicella RN1]